jgi:hypothetical protein
VVRVLLDQRGVLVGPVVLVALAIRVAVVNLEARVGQVIQVILVVQVAMVQQVGHRLLPIQILEF